MAAGQQFRHSERLDQVVIGTELEQADLLGLFGLYRQHDDRYLRRRPQALDELGPSASGKTRSTITRSENCRVACFITSRGASASSTTNPSSSNPARRNRGSAPPRR